MSGPDDDADRRWRRVLWSLPTGLYVVGSRGTVDGEDRANLMTANLLVQVATAPRSVAVAVERQAVTAALVAAGEGFAVSLLAREDRTVVRRFSKPVTEIERDAAGQPTVMGGEPVHRAVTGAPVLSRAVAWLDCALRHQLDLGSHLLFVGEVVGADGPPGTGTFDVLRLEDTRMHYGG